MENVLGIINVLLRERSMKQVELAEKIGITRQGLNNYLRGEWEVPTIMKIKISKALNIDSSVIWDFLGHRTKEDDWKCSSKNTGVKQ